MERLGIWYNWPYGPEAVDTFDFEVKSNEMLEFISGNHHPVGRNGWSGGGAFLSKKRFVEHDPSETISIAPTKKPMYTGKLVTSPPSKPDFSSPLIPLETIGPELWNRAKPAKPDMSLGNAMYELKDLPGMVKQGYEKLRHLVERDPPYWIRKKYSKGVTLAGVSDYHLAVYFGWLPLLSDTIALYNTQRQSSNRIEQLLRDAGRPVRRKFQSDSYSSASDEVIAQGQSVNGLHLTPKFITQAYASTSAPWELTRHRSTKTWFSAQFRYYFDDCGELTRSQWNAKIRRRLFGLNPTPAAIYKAMPWSWLIDWFGNIGDNLSNLDSGVADRLIADYAFAMRHTTLYDTFEASTLFNENDVVVKRSASCKAGTDLKERVPASPFGFGLKIPDLSPFQIGILGALSGARTSGSGFGLAAS